MPTLREETLLLDHLRRRGLRATPERRALLRAIFAQHRHIDAEEILAAARAGGHKISRATVYRNLDLLVECGLVARVTLPGGRAVYEHLHPGLAHDHLSCRQCGRMVEFVSPGISALLVEICRAHDFDLATPQLQISGLCRACATAGQGRRAHG
ncbi:MAG TPA: Fur family transcriptional regulator [Thermoanaerobaculia bacterium]|jgi:Fur family ferric uptake transcriptional regulator